MKNNFGVTTGIVGLAASLIGMIFIWEKLPNQLPWLYSLPWGEKQLINRYWFLGGVAIVGVVFVLNIMLAKIFSRKDEVIGVVILWFGVATLAMYLTSAVKVLSLILKF